MPEPMKIRASKQLEKDLIASFLWRGLVRVLNERANQTSTKRLGPIEEVAREGEALVRPV